MTNQPTILIVDDVKSVRDSLDMILNENYHLLFAESGEEALKIFQNNRIDLILLDIGLNDIDGIDLLKKFKYIDPETAIILVSAIIKEQTAATAIKLGACDLITKPFKVVDIENKVKKALE